MKSMKSVMGHGRSVSNIQEFHGSFSSKWYISTIKEATASEIKDWKLHKFDTQDKPERQN